MDRTNTTDDDAGDHAIGRNQRSGVALILVVGMLALMMVLGVAFAIFMRTERLAAGSYRNDVVARQLLQVALNEALTAIEADEAGGKVYPSSDVLTSPGGMPIDGATNAPVAEWIPTSIFAAITNLPYWIPVSHPGMEGRVGYIVFNCSGLLDANHAGGTNAGGLMPRGLGTNVAEVQITRLPDVSNATTLVSGRSYETAQELLTLGTNSGALRTAPDSLVTYSAFVSSGAVVDISGDESILDTTDKRTNIVAALIRSGIPASEAGFVYTNLLDYVDTNSVPRDLGSPCTEAVPMINEIQVSNLVVFPPASAGMCMSAVKVSIEWFYPFVKASVNDFVVGCDIVVAKVGATKDIYVPPSVIDGRMASRYVSGSDINRHRSVSTNCATAFVPYVTNDTIQLSIQVGVRMFLGTNVVDSVPYPYDAARFFAFTTTSIRIPAVPPLSTGTTSGAECCDPRFNWDVSQGSAGAQQWANYLPPIFSGSLWGTNWFATNYMAGAMASAETSKDMEMYVADAPLKTPAELSYLLRGARGRAVTGVSDRWSTIKLYNDNRRVIPIDRVLDNFIMGTNTVLRGRLNPNTRDTEAMAAVLDGMPVDKYPGGPAAITSYDQALVLANDLIALRGSFDTLSSLGKATNLFSDAPLSGRTFFEKESIFRNTCGLVHPGQNYFMIVLCAETTKTVPLMTKKSVLSSVRALAEVWRNPYPSPGGGHQTIVRLLRPMDQE